MIIVNFPLLRALDCQRVKSVFNFLQISHGRLRMFHLAWHMPSSVGYSVHLWQDIETIRNIGNHSLCQSHTTQWKMPYWGRAHIFRVVIPASTSAELAWLFWLNFPVVLCITCYRSCQECWRGRLWEGHQYLLLACCTHYWGHVKVSSYLLNHTGTYARCRPWKSCKPTARWTKPAASKWYENIIDVFFDGLLKS